jgi:hypothetical protein
MEPVQEAVYKVRAVHDAPFCNPFGKIVRVEKFTSQQWNDRSNHADAMRAIKEKRRFAPWYRPLLRLELGNAEKKHRRDYEQIVGNTQYIYLETDKLLADTSLAGLPEDAIPLKHLSGKALSENDFASFKKQVEAERIVPYRILEQQPEEGGYTIAAIPEAVLKAESALSRRFSAGRSKSDGQLASLIRSFNRKGERPTTCILCNPEVASKIRYFFSPVKLGEKVETMPPHAVHISQNLSQAGYEKLVRGALARYRKENG